MGVSFLVLNLIWSVKICQLIGIILKTFFSSNCKVKGMNPKATKRYRPNCLMYTIHNVPSRPIRKKLRFLYKPVIEFGTRKWKAISWIWNKKEEYFFPVDLDIDWIVIQGRWNSGGPFGSAKDHLVCGAMRYYRI